MNVSSIGVVALGSAAIESPTANDANVKRNDQQPVEQPAVKAAKPAGTGQLVDKTA